jgi:hypothetical protein
VCVIKDEKAVQGEKFFACTIRIFQGDGTCARRAHGRGQCTFSGDHHSFTHKWDEKDPGPGSELIAKN